MRDRHCGVLLEQQQRHRLTDDVAAADDDRTLSGELDAIAAQEFHTAGGRVREQAWQTLDQQPGADWVNAIDILAWVELADRTGGYEAGRQRQLEQDAADCAIIA